MVDTFIYAYKLTKLQPAYLWIYFAILAFVLSLAYVLSKDISNKVIALLVFTIITISMSFFALMAIQPKGSYNEITANREMAFNTQKTCKISGLNAQQGGLLGIDMDAWTCPDGITRYLPTKYRPPLK